jgi:hypothetical protein
MRVEQEIVPKRSCEYKLGKKTHLRKLGTRTSMYKLEIDNVSSRAQSKDQTRLIT